MSLIAIDLEGEVMSQRQGSTELKVGIFLLLALVVGGAMTFIIGSANQTFESQATLYSSFSKVSGLAVGSQVRLAGLKVGVVDNIELNRGEKFKKQTKGIDGGPQWQLLKRRCLKMRVRCSKNKASCPRYNAECSDFTKKCLSFEDLCDRDQGRCQEYKLRCVPVKQKFVYVRMKVSRNILKWIRTDSIATVEGKGLLGDALVNITVGTSPNTVQSGAWITGVTPKGMSDFMEDGGRVMDRVKESLRSIDKILKQYRDPELAHNLKGIVSSVNGLLTRAEKGPGLMHDLFYSIPVRNRLRGILRQLEGIGKNLKQTIAQIEWFLKRIQKPGTLVRRLLMSKQGGRLAYDLKLLVRNARETMVSINKIAKAPQTKNTLLYKLLYEKKSAALLTNLTKASNDVRTIMKDIRRGKGTLGAIINDPTAFEDLKVVLGQIKRTRIFRQMVRFIIKRSDSEFKKARGAGRVIKK